MSTKASVLEAHDRLLAEMPPGASHMGCPICKNRETASGDIQDDQEVTRVATANGRTFTEEEHEALLTDAVRREVAEAVADKEQTLTELQNKVDALEAEKASLEAKVTETEEAFEDFKQQAERDREIAERREGRVAAIRAISAHELPDDYFTDARVTRWAEMADESFEAFLDDLSVTTVSTFTPEEAAGLEGLEGEARRDKIVAVVAARKGSEEQTTPKPETAAFSGGATPGSKAQDGPSTLGSWLRTRRPTAS